MKIMIEIANDVSLEDAMLLMLSISNVLDKEHLKHLVKDTKVSS